MKALSLRDGLLMTCAVVLSLSVVSQARAGFIATTGQTPLSEFTPQSTLVVLDKEFFGFDFTNIGFGGGAVPPDPAGVVITGGFNDQNNDSTWQFGEDIVLRINLGFGVGSGQTQNMTLRFGVRVLNDYPNAYIKDVGLEATGISALGNGVVNVSESVLDAPPPGSVPLINPNLQIGADSNGAVFTDYREFDPVKEVFIVKDISLSGGTATSGPSTAHISEIFQSFSQVPEPASIALVGLGSLMMLSSRRNRS